MTSEKTATTMQAVKKHPVTVKIRRFGRGSVFMFYNREQQSVQ
jgi:hypothetical protein